MILTNANSDKFLIIILGPTAVGKTSLAIEIAKHFSSEIISADSRQFYKELKIGTSFPSDKELASAKHHFLGNLSVDDYYNVSRFEKDVLAFLSNYFINNKNSIMVGGSGLYINAVCSGIDDLPDPDDQIRNKLKDDLLDFGIDDLRKRLKELDPEYYSIVDISNPNRIIRALEICLQTGKKYSELRTQKIKKRDFNIIKIGLYKEIEQLYQIINTRVDSMVASGLVEEARNLLKFKELNALNTVGYKELFSYFDNAISLEEAIKKIKTNTRHYAKRQLTWFRKDKSIKWFLPEETQEIINYLETECGIQAK